ncbi:MAG: DUF4445 domain-containing protein [Desulfobacterales bacterium]|nr:DUF4445 domain-containing protein [Desulfobacterales bacterium]
MKYNVSFQPTGQSSTISSDQSILECARQLDLDLINICGGLGTCGQCKVQILAGTVSDLTPKEHEALSEKQISKGYRLACQVKPLSDVKVYLLKESMTTPLRTQVEGMEIPVDPDPDVKRRFHDKGIELPSPTSSSLLGLAVDLGTTKIACYLVNLINGQLLASEGIMNPLIAYGDDLIARLGRARDSKEAKTMQERLINALNQSAADLCTKIDTDPQNIIETILVANTAMHHLFAGLRVDKLLTVPYSPEVLTHLDIEAGSLGLDISKGAYVHLLPNIAGYVGADHVAMILSTGISKSDKTILALDIGTNTEVCLVKKGNMTSASCASGPAFEGGCTQHGMRASDGAIEHVRIIDGNVTYKTIGNEPPKGLCGSGMLDALAQLYAAEIINSGGKLLDHPKTRTNNGIREFVLVDKHESALDNAVTITQKDIRALQLAKGAIQAGIEVLMMEQYITPSQIDEVVIAGAFGSYIDVSSAIAIGMLPNLPLDRFNQVGNAAGMGAKMALISSKKREEAKSIAEKVKYVELGGTQGFMDTFINATKIGR